MNNKYSIGILFCGGCNCYYDREKFYRELQENMKEDCVFSYYREGYEYNLVLMINGCQSECLIGHEYGADKLLINNKNYENAEKLIRDALKYS